MQKQPTWGVLVKSMLKTCSKFTGENLCQSLILIKLLCNIGLEYLFPRTTRVNHKQGENCLEVDLPDQSKAVFERTQWLTVGVVKLRMTDISSDKEGF